MCPWGFQFIRNGITPNRCSCWMRTVGTWVECLFLAGSYGSFSGWVEGNFIPENRELVFSVDWCLCLPDYLRLKPGYCPSRIPLLTVRAQSIPDSCLPPKCVSRPHLPIFTAPTQVKVTSISWLNYWTNLLIDLPVSSLSFAISSDFYFSIKQFIPLTLGLFCYFFSFLWQIHIF